MLELGPDLLAILRDGDAAAVVMVAAVPRSAPRGPGSAMAVAKDGRILGSISGGCVEGDAVMLATATLLDGRLRAATLGYSDDAAHAAGLACGGSVEVVVTRIDPGDATVTDALAACERDDPVRIAIALDGPRAGCVSDWAGSDPTGVVDHGGGRMLVVEHLPRRRLVIAGAGDHAMALSRVALAAGFSVAVCDVWERLVTPERFPNVDRLIAGLPAEHMADLVGASPATAAVCVLTHDERVDVPAIVAAFSCGAAFVGAMGARSTVAHRARLLRAAGLPERELAALHSPVGLDLKGTSPEDTALAVLAEIVASRYGGTARPLRDSSGSIHGAVPPAAVACVVPYTSVTPKMLIQETSEKRPLA